MESLFLGFSLFLFFFGGLATVLGVVLAFILPLRRCAEMMRRRLSRRQTRSIMNRGMRSRMVNIRPTVSQRSPLWLASFLFWVDCAVELCYTYVSNTTKGASNGKV